MYAFPDERIHSITFGVAGRKINDIPSNWINTWDNWKMMPTSRPFIAPPKERTRYVTVPGKQGVIDYSDAVGIHYGAREGSWEFAIDHEAATSAGLTWCDIYSDILTVLHGRIRKIVLEDDPEYFYIGRLSVNSLSPEKSFTKITIDYTIDPHKYNMKTAWRL